MLRLWKDGRIRLILYILETIKLICHVPVKLEHFRVKRTLSSLQELYCWGGMQTNV